MRPRRRRPYRMDIEPIFLGIDRRARYLGNFLSFGRRYFVHAALHLVGRADLASLGRCAHCARRSRQCSTSGMHHRCPSWWGLVAKRLRRIHTLIMQRWQHDRWGLRREHRSWLRTRRDSRRRVCRITRGPALDGWSRQGCGRRRKASHRCRSSSGANTRTNCSGFLPAWRMPLALY